MKRKKPELYINRSFDEKLLAWKGGLFENVVGEALVKAGAELAYFKRENATLEMDFFLRAGDSLVPVEVKGERARGRSLRALVDGEHYPDIRWGVKLAHGNVGYENQILTLPQWAAFLLPSLIREFAKRTSNL